TQRFNFSPRVGIGWDVAGNGRTAMRLVRAHLRFPERGIPVDQRELAALRQPHDRGGSAGTLRSAVRDLGGDPHPILTNRDTQFIPYGAFGGTDPNLNSPRVQQWNVTVERQLARMWQVAATYLGSYTDRLWNQVAINPGVFLGLEPCTLQGVFYATCTNN